MTDSLPTNDPFERIELLATKMGGIVIRPVPPGPGGDWKWYITGYSLFGPTQIYPTMGFVGRSLIEAIAAAEQYEKEKTNANA